MRQEYENIRVLVTGGAGFIGSHTVQTLIANGVSQVTILDNLSTGSWRKLLNIGGVKFRMGDIRSSVDVQAALEDVTHVIHLAAQVSVGKSIDEPALSADVNITGFVNLLDCARRANVKRIVYASSAAVYGNPAELPLQENSILAPLSPYGLEKQINDQYLGMTVVAEGVETQNQCDALVDAGVDAIQGHLYAPAMPQDALLTWLHQRGH